MSVFLHFKMSLFVFVLLSCHYSSFFKEDIFYHLCSFYQPVNCLMQGPAKSNIIVLVVIFVAIFSF